MKLTEWRELELHQVLDYAIQIYERGMNRKSRCSCSVNSCKEICVSLGSEVIYPIRQITRNPNKISPLMYKNILHNALSFLLNIVCFGSNEDVECEFTYEATADVRLYISTWIIPHIEYALCQTQREMIYRKDR